MIIIVVEGEDTGGVTEESRERPAPGQDEEGFGGPCVSVCYLQPTWCTPECVRKAVGKRKRDFTCLFEQKGKKTDAKENCKFVLQFVFPPLAVIHLHDYNDL